MFNPRINPTSSRYQISSKVLKNQINLAMMEMQDNIVRTPCERTSFLHKDNGINLFLKKENRQITGSIEARSALYALLQLSDAQKQNGVISASTADFALSLCHFGDKLKIPVTVVLPRTTQFKIHTYQQQTTVTIIFKGDNLNQAEVFALMLAKEKNMHYLKRCHTDVLISYGTLAMEIMEEVPFLKAVFVPYDKTELIKSFEIVMKDSNIKIITVQPKDIKSDEDVQSEGEITVEKNMIATAMLYLFTQKKCIVDVGGAACLGAMLDDSIYGYELQGKRVVIVLPSCHINMIDLIQYVEQALISKHRLMKFTLMIPKQPPSIAELYNMLMQLKVIIKNIQIQQKQTSMSEISVEVVCEINNERHAKMITDIIKLKYKNCKLKILNNFNPRFIFTE